jgi:hypothetical protein
MYTKQLNEKIEDRLLATHITNNPEFANACLSGNGLMIMDIIESEMKKHNMFTAGSKKLQADIIRMLQGKSQVSTKVGERVLMFAYNSRLAGIGMAVI